MWLLHFKNLLLFPIILNNLINQYIIIFNIIIIIRSIKYCFSVTYNQYNNLNFVRSYRSHIYFNDI